MGCVVGGCWRGYVLPPPPPPSSPSPVLRSRHCYLTLMTRCPPPPHLHATLHTASATIPTPATNAVNTIITLVMWVLLHRAYDRAAVRYHKKEATLNFPNEQARKECPCPPPPTPPHPHPHPHPTLPSSPAQRHFGCFSASPLPALAFHPRMRHPPSPFLLCTLGSPRRMSTTRCARCVTWVAACFAATSAAWSSICTA